MANDHNPSITFFFDIVCFIQSDVTFDQLPELKCPDQNFHAVFLRNFCHKIAIVFFLKN